MFLYKLRGIKFRSSFNGKEKLYVAYAGPQMVLMLFRAMKVIIMKDVIRISAYGLK